MEKVVIPSGAFLDESSKIDKMNDDYDSIEKLKKYENINNACNNISSTNSTPDSISGPTPPPSGISSKSNPKNPQPPQQQPSLSIEKMFETFHQASNGEFKPTFYNPFEVRHRRRTSRSQFKILERAFMDNCKPTSQTRKKLAEDLNMSVRSIQVWFQNRRAKLKSMLKNGKMTDQQMFDYLKSQKQQQQHQAINGSENESQTQDSPSSFEDSEVSDSEDNSEMTLADSDVFNVQKRSFPTSKVIVHDPPSFVCNPETMPYGNSYPNQVRTRSYSLPAIQRSPQLPFKQLQEALFGQPEQPPPQQQQQQQSSSSSNVSLSSLNAFQHYLRASNAVMSQVNNSPAPNYYNAPPVQAINIPQLNNFTPLNEYTQSHQVDPNRFRPRSSSFAVSTGNSRPMSSSNFSNDLLQMIKEDSPISEYMNISSYDNVQQHHLLPHILQHNPNYYDGNDSDILSHQIDSLDLDYFMATNGSSSSSAAATSYAQGGMYASNLHGGYSSHPHDPLESSSSLQSSSIPESPMNNSQNNENSHNYMNELDFLPQPTSEILLSTLIGDEHFLQ